MRFLKTIKVIAIIQNFSDVFIRESFLLEPDCWRQNRRRQHSAILLLGVISSRFLVRISHSPNHRSSNMGRAHYFSHVKPHHVFIEMGNETGNTCHCLQAQDRTSHYITNQMRRIILTLVIYAM